MYDVEAKIPYDSVANDKPSAEWEDVHNVPQLETDHAEYFEAKRVAEEYREYYRHVRVVKIHPGGTREVVTECPYTFAHTRHWCGYSECREG